jgi:hypothetical protein
MTDTPRYAIYLRALPIDRIALFRQQNRASHFQIVNHWELRARDT